MSIASWPGVKDGAESPAKMTPLPPNMLNCDQTDLFTYRRFFPLPSSLLPSPLSPLLFRLTKAHTREWRGSPALLGRGFFLSSIMVECCPHTRCKGV